MIKFEHILIIAAILIGTILSIWFFPHKPQESSVIKQIEQSEAIILFIEEQEWKKAEIILYTYYDNKQYKLIEKFYDELRKGWWVKLEKIK